MIQNCIKCFAEACRVINLGLHLNSSHDDFRPQRPHFTRGGAWTVVLQLCSLEPWASTEALWGCLGWVLGHRSHQSLKINTGFPAGSCWETVFEAVTAQTIVTSSSSLASLLIQSAFTEHTSCCELNVKDTDRSLPWRSTLASGRGAQGQCLGNQVPKVTGRFLPYLGRSSE